MPDSHHTTVTDERGGGDAAALTVTRVDPLVYGDQIKQLFLTNGRPEFPAYFDRAYRDAGADGATSWIGLDEDGGVRSHLARFPRRFLFGRRIVHGALLANLMVAKEHRTFWPGLALVRQVVKDSRQSGIDFLYADPNEPARAIAQAAGFRSVAELRRFVLPLTDGRRSVDLGIRLYHFIRRLSVKATPPLVLTERSARETPGAPHQAAATDARSLCPVRAASLYGGRLAGYPSADDRWYSFLAPGSGDVPVATVLVRGPDSRGVAVACAVQCAPLTLLSSVFVTLARWLRRSDTAWLEAWVVAESQAASEARRAGFWPRHDHIPLMALPLTALGTEATAAGSEWRVDPVDLDR